MPYALTDTGEVIVDGDMVLGMPEDLFQPPDALGANRMPSFVPFPSATIPYAYDADLTPAQLAAADRALNLVSMYAPVQFTELPAGSTGFSGIRFRRGDPTDFWCSSELGFQGPGSTTDVTINGCFPDAALGEDPTSALVHELGHALGLVHEHQRSDASTHVDYDSSCVDMPGLRSKSGAFGTQGDALGPYEISSIMHYGSYSLAKRNLPDFHPDDVHRTGADVVLPIDSRFQVGTTAPVMQEAMDRDGPFGNWYANSFAYRVDYDDGTYSASFQAHDETGTDHGVLPQVRSTEGSQFALVLHYPTVSGALPHATDAALDDENNWTIVDDSDQSEPDCPVLLRAGADFTDPDAAIATHPFLHTPGMLSALWQMYGGLSDRDGAAAVGDRFASGFAWGDFDGDTLLDVAVSNPSQDRVVIYRGAYGATTGETEVVPVESIMVTGARTLAAGDFNGDGYDDLAVGTPSVNAKGGSTVDAGGVVVLLGSDSGLDHGREPVTVESELADRVGNPIGLLPRTSGQAANIWHLHADQDATVVGVVTGPGVNLHDGTAASAYTPSSGPMVFDWLDADLLDLPTVDCDKASVLSDLFGTNGSRVGASLHVADLDLDGRDDLLVGAPGGKSHLEATDPTGNALSGYETTGVVLAYLGQQTLSASAEPLQIVDVLTPYTPQDYSTSLPMFRGSHQGSEFGWSVSTGDVSDNGCPDIIVGAYDDYALLPGSTPLETDGDHRGPSTNTPGRA